MMKNKKFRIFGITVVAVAALTAGFGGWYFVAGSNNYKNVFYPVRSSSLYPLHCTAPIPV